MEENLVDMIVRRLEKLENRSYKPFRDFRPRNRGSRNSVQRNKNFCNHCSFINKQLGVNLDTGHNPQTCTKRQLSVSVIECMGNNLDSFNHKFDLNYCETNLEAYSPNKLDCIIEENLSTNISNLGYELNFEPFEKINAESQHAIFNLLPQLIH